MRSKAEPLGEPPALLDRVRVLAEALGHPLGRGEHVRGVAAPLGLRLVERLPEPDRDHRVLERDPLARVHVDVARGDRGHPQPLGELGQQAVAAPVVAPERALELDPEAVGAEDAEEPAGRGRGLRVAPRLHARGHRAAPRAARQAHEPGGVRLERLQRDARLAVERVLAPAALGPALARPAASGPVRGGEDAAEVRVALARLAQERDVGAVPERQLGARDRADPERLEGMRHLHGAVEAVVVGQREGAVALLGCRAGQLGRM